MRAMVLRSPRTPLELIDVPRPEPNENEILVEVECCAVCRTDLHVVDGELTDPKLPLIPGHQIVGRTVASGRRVGIPWLAWTDGTCRYCIGGLENLCDRARFHGYTRDGGYAEYVIADARYCFDIPDEYTSQEAAPLLCAGLIGFRAYRLSGVRRPQSPLSLERSQSGDHGRRSPKIGFFGFGSSAQILAQVARADGVEVFAFTREGDAEARQFAMRMGARIGDPHDLDAAIVFAPVGALVIEALRRVVKGGTVVCAGIHMSDIPSFPYERLWGERVIRSVANLTRQDGLDFFARLHTLRIETERHTYPLDAANDALRALRAGELTGTAILEIR